MTQTLTEGQERQGVAQIPCGGHRGRLIFRLKRRLTEGQGEAFERIVKSKTGIEVRVTFPRSKDSEYCCLSISKEVAMEEVGAAREKILSVKNLPYKEDLEVAS